jgi:hypothetical protein
MPGTKTSVTDYKYFLSKGGLLSESNGIDRINEEVTSSPD